MPWSELGVSLERSILERLAFETLVSVFIISDAQDFDTDCVTTQSSTTEN